MNTFRLLQCWMFNVGCSMFALLILTGCGTTDNRRLTPGGSGWQSSYRVDLKKGTFEADNSKDNSIKKLVAKASTNGVAELTIQEMENRVNADAVQGAAATTAMLAEIIKAQGAVNAEYIKQIGNTLGIIANAAVAGMTGRPPTAIQPIPPTEPITPLAPLPSALPNPPLSTAPATPSPIVASPQPRVTLALPPAPIPVVSELPHADTPLPVERPRTDTPLPHP